MKKIVLCLILCNAGFLFAQEKFIPDAFFAGVGPETNLYTRSGSALGGNLIFGLDLNEHFSAGFKLGFYHNFKTVETREPVVFFRYYLPLFQKWVNKALFAQIELGSITFFETSYAPVTVVSTGFAAGWRFNLPYNYFVEPALRFGYPYMWAINVTAGYTFKATQRNVPLENVIYDNVIYDNVIYDNAPLNNGEKNENDY